MLTKKQQKQPIEIKGADRADVSFTIDYSDSFYRSDLTLRASTGQSVYSLLQSNTDDSDAAALDVMLDIKPDDVVYSRKKETVYHFRDLPAGQYEMKLH